MAPLNSKNRKKKIHSNFNPYSKTTPNHISDSQFRRNSSGIHISVSLSVEFHVFIQAYCHQRRSSRPPNPPIGGPRPTLRAQVSLKLLFGYVTIFSSADLFTTDLNCRKKLACDIISECNAILSRRI